MGAKMRVKFKVNKTSRSSLGNNQRSKLISKFSLYVFLILMFSSFAVADGMFAYYDVNVYTAKSLFANFDSAINIRQLLPTPYDLLQLNAKKMAVEEKVAGEFLVDALSGEELSSEGLSIKKSIGDKVQSETLLPGAIVPDTINQGTMRQDTFVVVSITQTGLVPEIVRVRVGQEIIWKNERESLGALIFGVREISSMRSKFLKPGDEFSTSFSELGEKVYVEGVVIGLAGKIIVS